ncbi:MAG: KilA-N domain-containing protein, partial [Bacteroidota bacterium]
LVVKSGRYGGTFAHRDIAIHFAMWLSPEFQIYLIKEFQRLKQKEYEHLGWSVKRELAKVNYHIHTQAIKEYLVPQLLNKEQINTIYANEADVLNVALFGISAGEWRIKYPHLEGNMRDYASMNELICMSNLENINSMLIQEKMEQKERLVKLNQLAIQQMTLLQNLKSRDLLK